MKSITWHAWLAFVILLTSALFWLNSASAEILFKADFETGDLSQFSGKSKNVRQGDIEVVTDIVHSGKYAGRFTIHEDDVFNARQLRAQINGPKVTVKEGSDTFMSFYLYMKDAPKDRDNFFYWEGSPPPGYNNVMTWWVEPKKDKDGTLIKYGTGNLGRKGVHWEADFTIGHWHQLAMHIHWSEDPAKGNAKLWWDGVVVLDKKVQTKGPQSVYFCQPGIHRDPHTKSVDTIYFDDFICATTLEEIEIQKPNPPKSNAQTPDVKRNIPYADKPDERQVLDVYAPPKAKNLPVVFWIHGGGWQAGDKTDVQKKPQVFADKGFVFVSTNYRLLPSVDMATLVRDIAKSIRWVHDHIAEYGGDPKRLFIMGHSAGAQLAALICTDERYLKAEGLSLAIIKGCVPVDGDTYDVPAIIETRETRSRVHGLPQPKFGPREKFGNDPEKHKDFSVVTHVAKDKGIPPFLILHVAENPDTSAQSQRLGNVLKNAGVPATIFGAKETTHSKINANLGANDDPATLALFEFLDKTLKQPKAEQNKAEPRTPPVISAIGERLRQDVTAKEIAGAVTLVATPDRIVHLEATGQASLSPAEKMETDAIFWIASMSKPTLATLILMLQDDGLLSVDDPVDKYLPDFKGLKTADGKPAKVTIRHLLTHTSGLSEITAEQARNSKTLADVIPLYVAKPVAFTPGSKWVYCQSGINTAGRIAEVVTGEPLEKLMKKRLFDPLGMKDTTFYLTEKQLPRFAKSYRRTDKGELEVTAIGFLNGKSPTSVDRFPAPNGGLFSTASDYARFCQMILRGGELDGKRYLKPETVKLMTTIQTGDLKTGFTDGNGWGLGWCVVRKPQGVTAVLSPGAFGHGGAYGTQAWIDPGTKRIYVLMVQRANFPNSDASEVRRGFQEAASEAFSKVKDK